MTIAKFAIKNINWKTVRSNLVKNDAKLQVQIYQDTEKFGI